MAKDKAAKAVSKKKDASTKQAKLSKSTKSTSKSSGLSEERIADSDSENEAPAPKTATPKKAASKEIVPKSSSKKESTKKSKAVSPPSSDSEESSSEEEEKETAKVVPKKPDGVPAKVNGVKRKAEEDESSAEGSSGSDEETEAEKPHAKKAKTAPTKAASPPPSDEEENSEEEKPAAATKTTTSKDKQPATTQQQQQQSSLQSIPAKPFEPPTGYSSLDVEEPDSDSHLAKKSLAGKQIWHITAPAGVPIKSITEVALDTVSNGIPVLKYKDVDYVLNEDKSYDTKFSSVLLPGDAVYQHAGQSIDRTLRLQQKIELPNLSKKQADLNTGSNAAADIAQASVSDIRPQPKGLKMRYKPPGFGKGDPGMMSGSSEDEGEQTESGGFQFPKALGAHGAADEPETAITEKSRKKDKKRRKSENLIDGDVEMVNGDSMPPPSKKKKKKQEDGLERVASKESEKSQEREDETPEEKARRKEQRRLRKEAKKRAKEGESGVEKAF